MGLNIASKYPLQVLLAEDNLVNQLVILKMLDRMGYLADLAKNGIEVLELLKRKSYDLILMDIRMPRMDGVEATKEIKEIYGEECPVIIAVTADVFEGAKEKYLSVGLDDYIGKPIERNDLQNIIIKWAEKIYSREAIPE